MTSPAGAAPVPGAVLVCGLLVTGTALGIAGIDLVLPAVPALPALLGGTPEAAQLVLASYAAGTGAGLLLFGELGARFDQRALLIGSLTAFAALSVVAGLSSSLDGLIALRFLQGTTGAAAAVFAPGMIRALFSETGAIRAIGILGSVESLVPAVAPTVGVWLLAQFGWRSSFFCLAAGAVAAALAIAWRRHRLPDSSGSEVPRALHQGYRRLFGNVVYLRYALSQAASLGALLIFVFGAPAVIVGSLGGSLGDFIVLQLSGISTFIVAANLAGGFASRVGPERLIAAGSALSAGGAGALLAYALGGGEDPGWLAALFVPMNLGLGLRGPPGFFRAVLAARDDDARGAALMMLLVLLTTAAGTTLVAPFITAGLVPLTLTATVVSLCSLVLLWRLPSLDDAPARTVG